MNSIKFLGAFITGVALGTVVGILVAPESGKKTRKRLADESKRIKGEFSDTLSKTLDTVKSSYNKKLDEYAEAGKGAVESTKNTLKV
ncbi:MAG TPA: YtxH domain-containing protein [Cyclobacteriaceae bacterium]|nr:YtxH domain-containing protein [Cyclobacteriaceae bacterium]